jgi:hypothetical protein
MVNEPGVAKSALEYLEEWFQAQCDGHWEHSYGIKIETTDNPGWYVEIDLKETQWEEVEKSFVRFEISDAEWVQFEVRGGTFRGSCDVASLNQLLFRFLSIV